jgi:hypothetical protein
MRTRVDETRTVVLRAAVLGFACATGYNSIVAIRESLPGEPLGIRIPLPVSTGILVGWGSAVAAPWPMPVAALWAGTRVRKGVQGWALVCAGLGIAGVVGILVEPNTYRAQSWSPSTRRAVFLHISTSLALTVAAGWHLRRAR